MKIFPPKYPIDRYGALFDGHTHTYFDYHDGMITPDDLIKCTQQRGFNWVCAMAHDTAVGGKKIATKAKEYGLPCIVGIEISTIRNHLLGFGVQEWPYRRNTLDPEEAIDKLRAQGCAIFISHPSSNPRSIKNGIWTPDIIKRLDVDGIEWTNATTYFQNFKTYKQYATFPKGRRIAGTDAHHPATFGYSFTQVAVNSENPDDLVSAMKRGKCRAYSTYPPLSATIFMMIQSIGQNKLRKKKFIEGRWVKATGDRPGSLVPNQIPTNKDWEKKLLQKPILHTDWGL